jgi:hypothetical protein
MLLLRQQNEVWEPSNKQYSFGIRGPLDREVISLFSVLKGMLRPIVGVAVGRAGNPNAVCPITEQDDELVTLGIYFGDQREQKQSDGARGTNGGSRNAYRVLVGKRQGQR